MDVRGGLAIAALLVGMGVAWATPTTTGPAAVIEDALARAGADGIVLLGNSKVSTDLDLDQLRAALGPDAPPIAPANVYGTSAPVWYAVLKNRVYSNGHRPRLLVIFAPLETALTTDLPAEPARAVLAAQLGEDEPVVTRKVFGGVFDAEVRERLRRVLLPVCHPDRAAREEAPPPPAATNAELAPERSFLADILALAREHGTPTLFVRTPFAPSRAVQDDLPPAQVEAAVALIASHGAGWVDLSDGAPEAAFGDGVHMNAAGRRAMTARLAAALRPVIAGGPLPVQDVAAPARRVTREGTPPADLPLTVTGAEGCARVATHPLLATLGAEALVARGYGAVSPFVPKQGRAALRAGESSGCGGTYAARGDTLAIDGYAGHGDTFSLVPSPDLPVRGPLGEEAWWVHPGTSLVVEVPPLAAGAKVEVVTTAFGEGGPTTTTTTTRETPIPIPAPADGPWILVEHVRAAGVDVLGGPLHLDLLAGEVTYAAPPSPLPAMPAGRPTPDGTLLRVELPAGLPSDEAVFEAAGRGRCAPVEVLRDGAPADALDAVPTRRGLVLTTRDCAAVDPAGLSWRLDPARGCRASDDARWLYPGDVATFAATVRAPLARAGRLRLDLAGGLVGDADPDATLAVDVSVDGKRWASATFPRSRFEADPPTLELPPRRLREGARVQVRVAASEGSSWLLLTGALLTEATAVPFARWAIP